MEAEASRKQFVSRIQAQLPTASSEGRLDLDLREYDPNVIRTLLYADYAELYSLNRANHQR